MTSAWSKQSTHRIQLFWWTCYVLNDYVCSRYDDDDDNDHATTTTTTTTTTNNNNNNNYPLIIENIKSLQVKKPENGYYEGRIQTT